MSEDLRDLLEGVPDPKLPFSWDTLPRVARAAGGYRSISAQAEWSTSLADGCSIRLTSLYQYLTYGGVLAGLPLDDSSRAIPVHHAIEVAAHDFDVAVDQVCVLPPTLQQSTVRRRTEGKVDELSVDFLPAITCVASFMSSVPVRDDDALGSRAVVVWFQNAFGLPEEAGVMLSLRGMDWGRVATDWVP